MAAPAPSTLNIITSALRKLGAIGAGESAPSAEDIDLALDEFNGMAEQLNLRHRNSFFERTQAFPFLISQQSYTIGPTGDFVVAAGPRPQRIEYANLVITGLNNNVEINCAIIHIDQYVKISVPSLPSQFPQLIYYQPTVPNGTIYPYPAFPTATSYQLSLTWWNMLDTVDIGDITTPLILPQGYRRGLATKLAVMCYPAFPDRSDLEELLRQDREVWADIQGGNVFPPKISSTDGIGIGTGSFNYISREFT